MRTAPLMAIVLEDELKKCGVHGIDLAACEGIARRMVARTAAGEWSSPRPPIERVSVAPLPPIAAAASPAYVLSRPAIVGLLLALAIAAALIAFATRAASGSCTYIPATTSLAGQCDDRR